MRKGNVSYALASLFSFFPLSEKISLSLPSRLCRFSRFCWLANRDEPVGELFPLLSFPWPGNEIVRDVLRAGVAGGGGAAVDELAPLKVLECPLTAGGSTATTWGVGSEAAAEALVAAAPTTGAGSAAGVRETIASAPTAGVGSATGALVAAASTTGVGSATGAGETAASATTSGVGSATGT